jgi:sulfatase modifying factor 1
MTRVRMHMAAAAFGLGAMVGPAGAAVNIEYVPVGNAGNAADTTTYGAVPTGYAIGKYEVTNVQYTEFLNAVDQTGTNAFALYNANMGTNANAGGIGFASTNANGSKYVVQSGEGNRPVTFVSWYDAARMANWLHNGQGSASTETGAYTFGTLGASAIPTAGSSITRNPGSTVFIPTENEWYKAAYHQPSNASGDTDNYWLYPTGTNTEPNSDQPPGAGSITTNVGNFYRDDAAVGFNDGFAVPGSTSYSSSQNYLTDVGAYTAADSFYGTFDQGGNVWEWNETLIGSSRGLRGGSWFGYSDNLRSDFRGVDGPAGENFDIGFRLASIPEPSSCVVGLGIAAVMLRRRRARA